MNSAKSLLWYVCGLAHEDMADLFRERGVERDAVAVTVCCFLSGHDRVIRRFRVGLAT